jgi:hypothetical protein
LMRNGSSIALWVDGVQRFLANDTTFGAGAVGFGSFNDAAYFDDVRVASTSSTMFSPIVYSGNRANYDELTPSRWSLVTDGGDRRYFLSTSSFDGGATGALGEYALVNDRTYGDFNLTVRVRTAESLADNRGADICLVYGYRDPDHYYYAMLNGVAANNQIFRYEAGVRTPVSAAGPALITDNAYHDVRLSRRAGTVTVSVDGVDRLVTTSATAASGAVGIGSFNDSFYFDDLAVTLPVLAAIAACPDCVPPPPDEASDEREDPGLPLVGGCAATGPGWLAALAAVALGRRSRRRVTARPHRCSGFCSSGAPC